MSSPRPRGVPDSLAGSSSRLRLPWICALLVAAAGTSLPAQQTAEELSPRDIAELYSASVAQVLVEAGDAGLGQGTAFPLTEDEIAFFEKQSAKTNNQTVFLTVQDLDPSDILLSRLGSEIPTIKPGSLKSVTAHGSILDPASNKPGTHVSLMITHRGDHCFEISYSSFSDPESGSGVTYVAEKRDDRWELTEGDSAWVS